MGTRGRRASKEERLEVSDLGPIERVVLKPRELTVIAGEQATGKSLVAQLLYFFRGLEGHLANRFKPDLRKQKAWKAELVRGLLDDLRGVSFGYFANQKARIAYRPKGVESDLTLSVYQANRRISPGRMLGRKMESWTSDWERSPAKLSKPTRPQIFVPTERSLFTRFIQQQPKILFSDYQPLPVREFANTLQTALDRYAESPAAGRRLRKLQRAALRGAAYVPKRGRRIWKWKTSNGDGKSAKILPIEAVASGQMEAWPFFAVAEAYLDRGIEADYYLEEPETHLHPVAQVKIMDAIALLIDSGNRVVLTTHSPYMLYRLNNLIQRHLNRGAGTYKQDSALAISPDRVSAYCLGDRRRDIMDRDGTGLVDAEELERVADDLGGEFEKLLDEGQPR
ncbi:MAG: AAA family ATPase [Polyangia bacterium]